jgi:phage/plasmid-associated DNA primase
MRWYDSPGGLSTPQTVKESTGFHRAGLDDIQQFIDEFCAMKLDSFTASAELHHAYKKWCEDNGIKWRYQRQFSLSLSSKGFDVTRRRVNGKLKRGISGLVLALSQE